MLIIYNYSFFFSTIACYQSTTTSTSETVLLFFSALLILLPFFCSLFFFVLFVVVVPHHHHFILVGWDICVTTCYYLQHYCYYYLPHIPSSSSLLDRCQHNRIRPTQALALSDVHQQALFRAAFTHGAVDDGAPRTVRSKSIHGEGDGEGAAWRTATFGVQQDYAGRSARS